MRNKIFQAIIAASLLALLSSGCTQAVTAHYQASRDEIIAKIPAMVAIEQRANGLLQIIGVLEMQKSINMDLRRELKLRYDIYYVYHKAAVIDAVKGADSFHDNVEAANAELDAIERLLNAMVT
jgi:hypothetical protein